MGCGSIRNSTLNINIINIFLEESSASAPLALTGYKTVVRLFPHEAADLEPCLEAAEEEAKKANLETWSTLQPERI